MITLYWFVQVCSFIVLHMKYVISVFYYPGFIFVTIFIPLVCMIIARLILEFLMMIHNNQELINTIKKILLIFPEGILIQTVDEKSGKLVVQLVNDTAAKEIIEYSEPCGNPINDENLKYDFKIVNNKSTSLSFDDDRPDSITKLSSLLETHVDEIQAHKTEVVSSIEL